MRKMFSVFKTILPLALILSVLFLSTRTVGATDWTYLPLILQAWSGTPPLTVKNNCAFPIWVQQDKRTMLPNTPLIQKIEAQGSFDYVVDPRGIVSNRYWPKWGCDEQGTHCAWGQSVGGTGGPDDYPPCPPGGCHPPADSKLEVTWGCTYPDPATNPLCIHKMSQTYYNGSAVDGYSLPFEVTRSGDPSASCQDINCSGLNATACPTDDNLSQGKTDVHLQYSAMDLRVLLSGQEKATACLSPCKKLNYPTSGGLGLGEQTDPVIMYCCPTPPITSLECKEGPVPNTKYVTTIHTMCPNTYGYAYDDLLGGFNCHYNTKLTLTFCPGT